MGVDPHSHSHRARKFVGEFALWESAIAARNRADKLEIKPLSGTAKETRVGD